MDTDENDVFDESVDPYDRAIDFEYDDGIADLPPDETEEADEDDWDSFWDDDTSPAPAGCSNDEMDDYDELDD